MKHTYLGMDIGATKTDVILAGKSGETILKFKADGINIHNQTKKEAGEIFEKILIKIKSAPQLKPSWKIKSACIGMASFDSEKDKKTWQQIIKQAFKDQQVKYDQIRLVSDAFLSLKSGTQQLPAMSLIVGTGTNCYGLGADLKEYKAGDWGYLVGDQGSGYWMGKKILETAVKELDGRLPESLISDQVLSFTKAKSLEELIDWTYQHEQVKDIAQLAQLLHNPVLFDANQTQKLIHIAIFELTQSISAVYQQMKLDQPVKLVCTGGILNIPDFKDTFQKDIHSTLHQIRPIFPKFKPGNTAIQLAFDSFKTSELPKSVKFHSSA